MAAISGGLPSAFLLLFGMRLINAIVTQESISQKLSQRKIAQMNGQIIIGALFPIHEQPTIKSAFTRQCGRVREQYGMHRVEAFIKTIREINDQGKILPNITLGLDIRDTCWYPPVALEQSIDFIRNSLAHLDRSTRSRHNSSSRRHNSGSASSDEDCGRDIGKPIASLIGPGSSSVTIQVQSLLQLFKIPQIGYSATSMDLSKKDEYRYFLRVVPPDNLQAQVLVDIVVRYGWKYLSLLHSKGNYGSRGMDEFKKILEKTDVCTDQELDIDNKEELSTFESIAKNLFLHSNPARVVICFCQGETVRKLFTAMKRLNITRKGYLIVGSDGWADRPDVLGEMVNSETQKRVMSEDVVGGISIRLHSPKVPDFDEYFWSLKPRSNNPNPWFNEFWEQKFDCTFSKKKTNIPRCTGKESLNTVDYRQDTKLGFVVNSVYSVAYGLSSMQRQVCGNKPGICRGFLPVNGSLLLEHLLNVSFTSYSGEKLLFDSKGDPPGRYDIMNYRSWRNKTTGELRFDYVQVGSWQQGNLSMQDHLIMWPKLRGREMASVTSICSPPCRLGEIKVISIEKKKCCWKCKMCKDDEYIEYGSEERCIPCGAGKLPSKDRTACVFIEVEYMKWSDTQAVVSMVIACLGIMFTIAVTTVIARNNNTPVVKASTRELIYFILAGIILSYCTSFVLIAKPSVVSCYLSRILPGISFSLIYGALVTKTNRIARILAGSKKKIMTRKPRFLSTTAQIIICCLINAVECSIIVAMLIVEPADPKKDYSTLNRVKLICNTSSRGVIVPLGLDILLICLCTVYAIRTRNLPENFNEAKFIGFTMYTTCVIWIGFVSIYFGSDNKVIAMCITMSLSASVALVLLFFPKIYIILCKPEKNQRSAFTTSKDIRCHIGPGRSSSKSTTDQSKGFESAALTVIRQKNYFNRWKHQSSRGVSRCSSEENHRPVPAPHSGPSELKTSHQNSRDPSTVHKLHHDSWVQTDDDLVSMWVRRRRSRNRRGIDVCPSCQSRIVAQTTPGAAKGFAECDADDEDISSDDDECDATRVNEVAPRQTETTPLIHSTMPPPLDWSHDAAPLIPLSGQTDPSRLASSGSMATSSLRSRHLSNSSSSADQCMPDRLSIEDLSVLGLRLLDEEEKSNQRFSIYMKEHGVEFDLDTVQTSEV